MNRELRPMREHVPNDTNDTGDTVDATTILENVVRLDQMIDEGSLRELGALPFLELSKHLRIKKTGLD